MHPVAALCALSGVLISLVYFFQPAGVDYHFHLIVVEGVWSEPPKPTKFFSVLRAVVMIMLESRHRALINHARLFLRSSSAEVPEGHLTLYRVIALRAPRCHIIAQVLDLCNRQILV